MEGLTSDEPSPRPTTYYICLKQNHMEINLCAATPKKVNLGCFNKHALTPGLCHAD